MRQRIPHAVLAVFLLFFSLFLRKIWAYLPYYINVWIGDYLWALMLWFVFRAMFPNVPLLRAAVGLILFSWAVEISQAFHTPWLDDFRSTRLGGLLLGHGFLWSDMLAYAAGIVTGWGLNSLYSDGQQR